MGHQKLVTTDPSASYPDFLKKSQKIKKQHSDNSHPVVIDMHKSTSADELKALFEKHPDCSIVDNYAEQYAELLLSKNAHLYNANHQVQVASIKKLLKEHYGETPPWRLGSWVYYPWKRELVHILKQEDFEALRTIRNRDLITTQEQETLFNFNALCFGMSVGSACSLALGQSGISRRIKLVDGAVISGSNLNRILTGVSSVGQNKAQVIGEKIYEMNPYSTVGYFEKADASNISEIFENPWQTQVAVDEIDDIQMKVRIRSEARKRGIPVVMATELGDTVMLDVERYDLEPDRQLFHGIVPGIDKLVDEEIENRREWMKHAVTIIDPKNMPVRMQESLLKIGSTIVTHPQLGSTVMMTGGVLAFAVKQIALGNELKSGRYIVSLEKELLASHRTRTHRRHHKKHTKIMKTAIQSM